MQENRYGGAPDTSATDDMLGLEQYTKGLADFISTCNTPMTIALQGGWGTGKTTMYQLVKKQMLQSCMVEEDQFVELNTWQFEVMDGSSNLTLLLISKIIERLYGKGIWDKEDASVEKVAKTLGRIVRFPIAIGLEKATGLGSVADFISKILKVLQNESDNALKSLGEEYDLVGTLKEQIKDKIGENGRLIVFIDDLDRLRPGKAVELLEGIKNYLDCEGCVFVLALDQQVVFAGVREKFGQKEGEALQNLFFDKIIQVPFKLPVNNYNINSYVEDLLECGDQTQQYVNAIQLLVNDEDTDDVTISVNNPRAIKRYVNLFQLYRAIIAPTGGGQMADADPCLFALIVFYSRFPKDYEELITDVQSLDTQEAEAQKKVLPTVLDRWVEACAPDNSGGLRNTLLEMVGKLSKVLSDNGRQGINISTLLNEAQNDNGLGERQKFLLRKATQTASEANMLLRTAGYLEGKPGNWSVTDKGRSIGIYTEKREGEKGEYVAILYSPRAYSPVIEALTSEANMV